jgi:hypothetical protein
MSKIKTFRGLLEDQEQRKIHLSGGEDDKGFKIHKLQIIPNDMGTAGGDAASYVVKIFSTEQTIGATPGEIIDFDDDTLLAAATFERHTSGGTATPVIIVFDQTVVNQDIYINLHDAQSGKGCNYYLELEEVTMGKGEQAVVNFSAALLHGE